MTTHFFGIDLAWGERNPDGLAWLSTHTARPPAPVRAHETALAHGDDACLQWLRERLGPRDRALVLVDAPLVIPNRTGARPVDKLTHTLFRRQHAGCHPAYLDKCPRPPRLCRRLQEEGYDVGWRLTGPKRVVAEVYPHPAMVRLFGLPRILKYKRGPVTERRAEFARLQRLLRRCRREHFPDLELAPACRRLLRQPWTKPVEDQTDALFCALIGLWHWQHRGRLTDILGDLKTGFILVPKSPPNT
ncbi:MAG: DUF429 domain-containing protein [Verrucomicrobiota bacterium]